MHHKKTKKNKTKAKKTTRGKDKISIMPSDFFLRDIHAHRLDPTLDKKGEHRSLRQLEALQSGQHLQRNKTK